MLLLVFNTWEPSHADYRHGRLLLAVILSMDFDNNNNNKNQTCRPHTF